MKNILTILMAVLLFTSCKKKDDTIYLSQDIKTKFGFKPGSYWIYRDSISGRVDSCWLDGIYLGIGDDGPSNPTPYEYLGIVLNQMPKDTNTHERIKWGFFFSKRMVKLQGSKMVNGIEPQIPPFTNFLYPIPKDSTAYLDVFALAPHTFFDVNRISFNHYDGIATYSFNDSVGYIKMVVNYEEKYRIGDSIFTVKINEVWELQRWHVIK